MSHSILRVFPKILCLFQLFCVREYANAKRWYGVVFCVSCLTWERGGKTPRRKPSAVLFVIWRLDQGDGSYYILWPRAKLLLTPLSFCRKHIRTVHVDWVACVARIDGSHSRLGQRWITNDTLYNCVVMMFAISIADCRRWCDDG